MSTSICDTDLPEYGVNACATVIQADVDAMGLLKVGQTTVTDPAIAADWLTAIAAHDADIMKNIKVSMPEPSERTQANPRVQGPENILNGFNYVFNIEDPNVSDANTAFYAALNGQFRHIAVRLYYESQSLKAFFPFYFIMKPVYGENNNVLMYKGTASAKFAPNDTIDLFNTPAGIFD